MKRYIQTDELQKYIDWDNIIPMSRDAGGHDSQMKGLFKNATVIAHWNDGNWQGMVATCVKFNKGKFKNRYAIYNDYYGSCSGCDAWVSASTDNVIKMCIDLSNSAYIFNNLDDIRVFLGSNLEHENDWSSWDNPARNLLEHINNGIIE
jgi:hypothetical protein